MGRGTGAAAGAMTRPRGQELAGAAAEACRRLLNAPDARAEKPAVIPYKRRRASSVRVTVGDRTVIATRRRKAAMARKEAGVLRSLGEEQAPVPAVLAFDGEWLIQEDLGTRRLSRILRDADAVEGEAWLDRALRALAACQEAGRRTGLERKVPWVVNRRLRLGAPGRLGETLGVPAPPLPRQLAELYDAAPRRHFVKWDARPGNAMVRADGTIAWIDWEHCCRSERLADLVWLLCDEWVPDDPAAEQRLLEEHRHAFVGGGARQTDYLALFGTLHMIVRLDVILKLKGNGPWWNADVCLEHDLLGVTADETAALARRAARWAARAAVTEPLAPWLRELAPRLR